MTEHVDSEFYQSFMQNVQAHPTAEKPSKDKKKLFFVIGGASAVLVLIIVVIAVALINKPQSEDSLEQIDPDQRIAEQEKLYTFLDDIANERWMEASYSMPNVTMDTLDPCEKASYYRATIKLLNHNPKANVNRDYSMKQIKASSKLCGKYDNTLGELE